MTIGEKIHTLRKQYGLTLEDVGKAVGVGKSTVRKWETGLIANMGRDKIQALAIVLHTTPAYLMGWDEIESEVAEEVKLIERIQAVWGKEMVFLMQHYCELNADGQKTLLNIAESLNELNKYKK